MYVAKGLLPFQLNEFAPLAVNVAVEPIQIALGPETLNTGKNTSTFTVCVLLQPALVPVTE